MSLVHVFAQAFLPIWLHAQAVHGLRMNPQVQSDTALRMTAKEQDDDTSAKLAYMSFVYNEPITDPKLFDELDIIYRNKEIIPSRLIPCQPILMKEGFSARELQKTYCGTKFDFRKAVQLQRANPFTQDKVMLAPTHSLKNLKRSFEHNTWVEVQRWGSERQPEGNTTPFNGARKGEGKYGVWFLPLKGTGVFVNIGRTLVFDTKEHIDTSDVEMFEDSACPHALKNGYDSVQYKSGAEDYHELVMCSGRGTTETLLSACPPYELRTGWNANKRCTCNDRMQNINCGQQVVPDGVNELCMQDWSFCH